MGVIFQALLSKLKGSQSIGFNALALFFGELLNKGGVSH
jgi:hypothetical protein